MPAARPWSVASSRLASTGRVLLVVTFVLFAVSLLVASSQAPGPKAQGPESNAQGPEPRAQSLPFWLDPEDARGYTGSPACERCHQEIYRTWADALHLRMTKTVQDAEILGDFSKGTRFEQHGRRYAMEQKDGRYFIAVGHGDRPAESFEVHYTLGFRRVQGYLSKLPDGRIYVLPAFWNREQRRWFDWKEITPVPDTDQDLRQIWNVTCYNCHATNLSKNFSFATRTYDTSWTEMGVGCESCHGPGQAHVALTEGWEREPASKPTYDRRRTNHDLSRTLKIFAARTATRRQVFDTCAYCHGNKNNLFTGFMPGARLEDHALPFLISQPVPADDPQGDFWPDGRPSRFNRPQALMQSACFLEGEATCVTCHAPHGSKHLPLLKVDIAQGDLLCLQCHGPEAAASARRGGGPMAARAVIDPTRISEHTFHAATSEGSRCINCHMSEVNWRLLMRRRDHTFKPPVPEMTSALGVPNACNTCHDDQTPEWATAQMARWYGADGQARRAREMAQATAFYEAASGSPAALPALAGIVIDRRRDPIARASAAEYIATLLRTTQGAAPTPGARTSQSQTSFEHAAQPGPPLGAGASDLSVGASGGRAASGRTAAPAGAPARPVVTATMVNTLMGAAADPEAIVRVQALRALATVGDLKAVPSMAARLQDDVRAVRVAAAEALLYLGVTNLPGRAGAALSQAQDEYAASLASFGDMPGDHVALAWLETQRGRQPEAEQAIQQALSLNPDDLQPRVIRGVIAARAGRYGDAIRDWTFVKQKAPAWPNIDRLIDEARKRQP